MCSPTLQARRKQVSLLVGGIMLVPQQNLGLLQITARHLASLGSCWSYWVQPSSTAAGWRTKCVAAAGIQTVTSLQAPGATCRAPQLGRIASAQQHGKVWQHVR